MAIDAGIYQLAGRGVKSIAEYDAEAAQGRQNKLAEMMSGMKMDEAKRGLAGDNALAQLIAGGKSSADVATGLASQGFGAQSLAYTKQQGEQAKQNAATEKDRLANTMQQLALGSQLLAGVKDQGSYDRARATAQSYGLNVEGMQPNYDPAFIAGKIKEGQTVAQQLDQKWKQMEYDTPNANAVLSAKTQAEGQVIQREGQQIQRDGQQVQIRGQDMTDSRMRETTATKVEENKLKRETKDETTNLTKSSQLASFDTMLGTLDRLSKHSGLSRSVGITGAFPTMPGSDSANFQAELNSFQSQAFIPMVAQLKGMGALSDAEGKKLTAAVGALDPKMGEAAFRESVARIMVDMQAARTRLSGGQAQEATGPKDEKQQSAPVTIKNAADYAKIPSGATYIDPKGQMRKKP